jgi:NitT/TauT family transport system substrate-binding protein
MFKLTLALDWHPNTNHTGFYVAKSLGYYSDEGIDLIIEPPSDEYTEQETPARRVVNGNADLCIAPSESAISCFLSRDAAKIKPIAIASILQRDTSAIVTNNISIKTPKDLSNKIYASYAGRFEMNIVNELVRKDGGSAVIEMKPPKLDCYDAMLRGEVDATWIFMNWEGIMAARAKVALNKFPLPEYGYSPVLLANPELLKTNSDTLRKFISCTEKGYRYAVENPEEAAKILYETANHYSLHKLSLDIVIESQQYVSSNGYYLSEDSRWGVMSEDRWVRFIHWLLENNCLYLNDEVVKEVDHKNLYTNELYKS